MRPPFQLSEEEGKLKSGGDSHVRLYLNLFLDDCGIRFAETDRYADRGTSHTIFPSSSSPPDETDTPVRRGLSVDPNPPATRVHLAVFATRPFKSGETLTGCQGSFAHLTEDENEALHLASSSSTDGAGAVADFSHLMTTEGGHRVFCGPARFVNHDCRNNVELVRDGLSIRFKAIRPIAEGEEVVTSYGRDYFGEGNRECLCGTCEREGKGAYGARDGDGESTVTTTETGTSTPEREKSRTRSGQAPTSSWKKQPSSTGARRAKKPVPPPRKPPVDRSSTAVALRLAAKRSLNDLAREEGQVWARGTALKADEPADRLPPVTYLALRDLRQSVVEGEEEEEEEMVRKLIGLKRRLVPSSSEDEDSSDNDDEEEREREREEERERKRRERKEPRRTYWQTTKQRETGVLPWEADRRPTASTSLPANNEELGPRRGRSSDSGAAKPRRPTGPKKSYWVSTKDLKERRLPWSGEKGKGEKTPATYLTPLTRTTSIAKRAAEGGRRFKGLPTAPKGGRLTVDALEPDEVQMLDSAVGRELLGMRRARKSTTKAEVVKEEEEEEAMDVDGEEEGTVSPPTSSPPVGRPHLREGADVVVSTPKKPGPSRLAPSDTLTMTPLDDDEEESVEGSERRGEEEEDELTDVEPAKPFSLIGKVSDRRRAMRMYMGQL